MLRRQNNRIAAALLADAFSLSTCTQTAALPAGGPIAQQQRFKTMSRGSPSNRSSSRVKRRSKAALEAERAIREAAPLPAAPTTPRKKVGRPANTEAKNPVSPLSKVSNVAEKRAGKKYSVEMDVSGLAEHDANFATVLEAARALREKRIKKSATLASSASAARGRDYFHETVSQLSARALLHEQLKALPTVAEREAFIRDVDERGRLISFSLPTPTMGFSRNLAVQLILFKAPSRAECRAVDAISAAGRAAAVKHNLDPRLATTSNQQDIAGTYGISVRPSDGILYSATDDVEAKAAAAANLVGHATKVESAIPIDSTGERRLATHQLVPRYDLPGNAPISERAAAIREAIAYGERLDAARRAADAAELELEGAELENAAAEGSADAAANAENGAKPKRRSSAEVKQAKELAKALKKSAPEAHMYGDLYSSANTTHATSEPTATTGADGVEVAEDDGSSTAPTAAAADADSPYSDARLRQTVYKMHLCSRLRLTVDISEDIGLSKSGKSINSCISKSLIGSSNLRVMMTVFRQAIVSREDLRHMFEDAALTVESIIAAVEAREARKKAASKRNSSKKGGGGGGDSSKTPSASSAGEEAAAEEAIGSDVTGDTKLSLEVTATAECTAEGGPATDDLAPANGDASSKKAPLPREAVLGTRIPFIDGIGYECRYHDRLLHIDLYPRVFRIGADEETPPSRVLRWAPTSATGRSNIYARSTLSPRNLQRTPFAAAVTVIVPARMRISRPHLASFFGLRPEHRLVAAFFGGTGSLTPVSSEETAQSNHNTVSMLYGEANQIGTGERSREPRPAAAPAMDPATAPAHHREQRMWEQYLVERDGLTRMGRDDVALAAAQVVGLLRDRHFSSSVFPDEADGGKAAADAGSNNNSNNDNNNDGADNKTPTVVPAATFEFLRHQTIQRVLDTAGANFRTVYSLETRRYFIESALSSKNAQNANEQPFSDAAQTTTPLTASFVGFVSGGSGGAGGTDAVTAALLGAAGNTIPRHLAAALGSGASAFAPPVGALRIPLGVFDLPHYQLIKRWAAEGLAAAGIVVAPAAPRS